MTYLPQPYYLDRDDMVKFILAIPTTGWTWKPVGITWHNTGSPNLKQWAAYPPAVKAAWGANYDHYCRFDEGWHSAPQLAGTPDDSFVLCEPRANGVHASCFNSDHFGVETIGDFRKGADDPLSGPGLASMQSSANIIAALCKRMGWEPTKSYQFPSRLPARWPSLPRQPRQRMHGRLQPRVRLALAVLNATSPPSPTVAARQRLPTFLPCPPPLLPLWPSSGLLRRSRGQLGWTSTGISAP